MIYLDNSATAQIAYKHSVLYMEFIRIAVIIRSGRLRSGRLRTISGRLWDSRLRYRRRIGHRRLGRRRSLRRLFDLRRSIFRAQSPIYRRSESKRWTIRPSPTLSRARFLISPQCFATEYSLRFAGNIIYPAEENSARSLIPDRRITATVKLRTISHIAEPIP